MKRIKVKDLIKHLKEMPQDANCVYACDEEGNNFQYVYFTPTLGHFDECEFTSIADEEEGRKPNAVCIN